MTEQNGSGKSNGFLGLFTKVKKLEKLNRFGYSFRATVIKSQLVVNYSIQQIGDNVFN